MKAAYLAVLVGILARVATGQLTPRQEVLAAMKQRPGDPWPRGVGHVVLATPGSPESEKAYLEPGGSFSPAFASFGVSVWVGDAQGRIVATSDTIALDQVTQQFFWPRGSQIPAVRTETPFYSLSCSSPGRGRWLLHLDAKAKSAPILVIRSVGPAGAPMESLEWQEGGLTVNHRWVLTPSPTLKPAQIQIGPEAVWGTPSRKANARFWRSDQGWGFARFAWPEGKSCELLIEDPETPPIVPLKFTSTKSALELGLPSRPFVDCLEAQVAHLMMGLVDNQTRPGDPNNYPLNWLRDGAYVVVALARAGRLEVARQLVQPLAENDFFGGFGSEADGPGLALWAMSEVSALLQDPGFEAKLWPHVQRKAGLILRMLEATAPLRHPFMGPVVPAYRSRPDLDLVCDAAKNGLITGRMDWHRPVLYVNAVSYRGLLDAAAIASHLSSASEAATWQAAAARLHRAWNEALNVPDFENERNYICGLYPTWIATNPEAYQRRLESFWKRAHDQQDQLLGMPLWTYFNLATAHQWLALGQPEHAWSEVRWFWSHQASPGLYTWWEGAGEENSFGRWGSLARGWVKPPYVTPHYWTSAEMLLLQLAMLAYVDDAASVRTLVIGAGVPKEWLTNRLSVAGVGTSIGKVDWTWTDGKIMVTVHGPQSPVRLGPAFGPETRLEVMAVRGR